jgi:hypothetical protein
VRRGAVDVADKAVAAARDGFDTAGAVFVAEGFAELGDVDGEVGLLDEGVGPAAAHEGFFFDQLAVALEEDDGLAGKGHELPLAKKEVLGAVEAEAAELPLEMIGPSHGAKPRI